MESKNKKKGIRWTKRLKAVVISVVLAVTVAIGGAATGIILANNNNKIGGEFADSTAAPSTTPEVTASSGLSKFPAGSNYYYTGINSSNDPAPGQSVTVNASAAWGSATNPYVIKTINDWVFFTNAVNNGTGAPSGGTAYASATYVVDAGGTLNFGSKIILPVGNASRPFTGTVYGGNTVISNAKLGYYTASGWNYSGLFGNTNGAKLYDFTIASSCSTVLSGSYDFSNTWPRIGSFVAQSATPYFVNCASKMSVSITNTSTVATNYARIGGLIGVNGSGSTLTFVGCSYIGNVTYRGNSATANDCGNDYARFGGFIGGKLAVSF